MLVVEEMIRVTTSNILITYPTNGNERMLCRLSRRYREDVAGKIHVSKPESARILGSLERTGFASSVTLVPENKLLDFLYFPLRLILLEKSGTTFRIDGTGQIVLDGNKHRFRASVVDRLIAFLTRAEMLAYNRLPPTRGLVKALPLPYSSVRIDALKEE
jgi:hypothetical protein